MESEAMGEESLKELVVICPICSQVTYLYAILGVWHPLKF